MTTAVSSPARRLLAATVTGAGPGLASHLDVHGPLRLDRRRIGDVATEIEQSGLTGRGGAGFPAWRKLALAAQQRRRAVLVVNAMEGEPASAKDRVLLEHAPHLVLDGAQVAASVIDAARVVLCVAAEHGGSSATVERAIAERQFAGIDRYQVEVVRPPSRYSAGEESALADWVSGGLGLPAFRPDKGVPLTVRARPAVVQNAETVGQMALIARHGALWFRAAGLPDAPGTTLASLSGAVPQPGVVEVELGTPLRQVVASGGWSGEANALLLGGYGGAWIAGTALDVAYAPGPLAEVGATVGAGVVGVLPGHACGVAETARIVSYLAGQSAGQCGPCAFGLPAVADDLIRLATGRGDVGLLARLDRRLAAVHGRGACGLPDGAVRLVRSALVVFGGDVALHARGKPCPGWALAPLFPTPGICGRP